MAEKYKLITDHIYLQLTPSNHTGNDNPQITMHIKEGIMTEGDIEVLRQCIGEGILRFGALTGFKFKAEIRP